MELRVVEKTVLALTHGVLSAKTSRPRPDGTFPAPFSVAGRSETDAKFPVSKSGFFAPSFSDPHFSCPAFSEFHKRCRTRVFFRWILFNFFVVYRVCELFCGSWAPFRLRFTRIFSGPAFIRWIARLTLTLATRL